MCSLSLDNFQQQTPYPVNCCLESYLLGAHDFGSCTAQNRPIKKNRTEQNRTQQSRIEQNQTSVQPVISNTQIKHVDICKQNKSIQQKRKEQTILISVDEYFLSRDTCTMVPRDRERPHRAAVHVCMSEACNVTDHNSELLSAIIRSWAYIHGYIYILYLQCNRK